MTTLVHKAPPPQWSALHRIAISAEPTLRKAFLSAVAQVQDGTAIAAVRRALEAGDLDAAADAVPWDDLAGPVLRDQFTRAIRDTYERAGLKTADLLPFPSEFVIADPRAANWIAEYSSTKIVEISETTRAGVRTALRLGMENGLSAQRMAQLVKPQIGLHEQWATAVSNYALELYADGKYTQDQLDRQVARYANQLRQARALSIARTEVQYAISAGREEAWEQAADQGYFDRSVAMRKWITSPGACDYCIWLGEQPAIPYNRDFVDENGEAVDVPAHPACRCGAELLPAGE